MDKDQVRKDMSRAGKITKHSISTGDVSAFLFLGIVSAEPDYRLSVMLNRHLGIDLRKDQHEITDGEMPDARSFSVFSTRPPSFSLISNRSMGTILLKKLKNIDFILRIHGDPDRQSAETLAASVRIIPEVTAVFIFDSREISDKSLVLLAL